MTVCQRPFYLEPVLSAWNQVEGVLDWPFIFMVEPTPTKPAMLRLIDAFPHPRKLVIENPVRLGVLSNPHAGLKMAFEKLDYDYVVLAEEDLLPAASVLSYFDFVNENFRDDKEVLTAGANPTILADSPESVRKIQEFQCWGWATWSNRWPLLSKTWDHDYGSGDDENSAAGWDWNIHLRVMPKNNMTAVYPGVPLIKNLGKYLGAHARPEDFESTQSPDFQQFRPELEFKIEC